MSIRNSRVPIGYHEVLTIVYYKFELLASSYDYVCLKAVVVLVVAAGDHYLPRTFGWEFSEYFYIWVFINHFRSQTIQMRCLKIYSGLVEPYPPIESKLDLVLSMQKGASNYLLGHDCFEAESVPQDGSEDLVVWSRFTLELLRSGVLELTFG